LQLASEAVVDENKSDLKDEVLQNILRLIEDYFVRAEDEKHSQKNKQFVFHIYMYICIYVYMYIW
jgi:hypothetical protein